MEELTEQLRQARDEAFCIFWGDYVIHPVVPGTEGAEDAFLPGKPCAEHYEAIYAAKKSILEKSGFEAEIEVICREYEAIAEYISKRMFEQGAYAAAKLLHADNK